MGATIVIALTATFTASVEFARRAVLGRRMERAMGGFKPKAVVLAAVRPASMRVGPRHGELVGENRSVS